MSSPNFLRMITLAEEFFETKTDPDQLSIDEHILSLLRGIHPSTMGEQATEDGPVAWTIVIPTTASIMHAYLEHACNERELFEQTLHEHNFDSVYLCSALVLPEFRCKGLARELTCRSIRSISETYPLKQLFYWEFSKEGTNLAEAVARELGLPLLKRV